MTDQKKSSTKSWAESMMEAEAQVDAFDPVVAKKAKNMYDQHSEVLQDMANLTAKLRFITYQASLRAGFDEQQALAIALGKMPPKKE